MATKNKQPPTAKDMVTKRQELMAKRQKIMQVITHTKEEFDQLRSSVMDETEKLLVDQIGTLLNTLKDIQPELSLTGISIQRALNASPGQTALILTLCMQGHAKLTSQISVQLLDTEQFVSWTGIWMYIKSAIAPARLSILQKIIAVLEDLVDNWTQCNIAMKNLMQQLNARNISTLKKGVTVYNLLSPMGQPGVVQVDQYPMSNTMSNAMCSNFCYLDSMAMITLAIAALRSLPSTYVAIS